MHVGAVGGITFTFTNRCGGTVWPGVLANSGSSALQTTGFELGPGETRSLAAPSGWSGRFWARTGCAFDASSGKGACATGDCGSGEVECRGRGAAPPATLAEFTLGGGGGKDYYDVSLVDGYNLPMVVEAAAPGCPVTGCLVDLNERCPAELRAGGQAQACRSACEAFGTPEYCCSGQFGNPDTCRPSVYSQMFKAACPRSYSYAYDDATSTFTCAATDYSITFCPPRSGRPNRSDPFALVLVSVSVSVTRPLQPNACLAMIYRIPATKWQLEIQMLEATTKWRAWHKLVVADRHCDTDTDGHNGRRI